MEDHETRRKIIRQWRSLPKDKRQTAEQAAAFIKKAVEENELQPSWRDPYQRMMGWLLPRIGRCATPFGACDGRAGTAFTALLVRAAPRSKSRSCSSRRRTARRNWREMWRLTCTPRVNLATSRQPLD